MSVVPLLKTASLKFKTLNKKNIIKCNRCRISATMKIHGDMKSVLLVFLFLCSNIDAKGKFYIVETDPGKFRSDRNVKCFRCSQ